MNNLSLHTTKNIIYFPDTLNIKTSVADILENNKFKRESFTISDKLRIAIRKEKRHLEKGNGLATVYLMVIITPALFQRDIIRMVLRFLLNKKIITQGCYTKRSQDYRVFQILLKLINQIIKP